jgi:hypothetical protein
MILLQIFFNKTFNVSTKSFLELRSIYLALEEIDHSIIISWVFECCAEFLLIVFLESPFTDITYIYVERERERESPRFQKLF